MKILSGIAFSLMFILLTVPVATDVGSSSAMYQVDRTNSGFYPDISINNTYPPVPIWEEETSFTLASNAISIDLDDDSVNDIIYAVGNGRLKALGGDWETLWKFGTNATRISTPAAADLDKDNDVEVVFAVEKGEEATLYCIDHLGIEMWNFSLPSFSIEAFPTIADITSDPGLEIVISVGKTPMGIATETSLFCISARGDEIWKYKRSELFYEITSTPVVEDIIDDSRPEIIFGMTGNGGIVVLDHEGNEVWKKIPGFRYTSPITYNIDKTGRSEVIVGVDDMVYCFDNEGNERWHYTVGEHIFATPLARDIDGDGNVEVLAASDYLYCLNANGGLKWKQPFREKVHHSSIALGDINTGAPEIIVGDQNGTLYAFSNNGDPLWDVSYGTQIQSSPVIADINNDDTPELILTLKRGDTNIVSFLDLPLSRIIPKFDFSIDFLSITPANPIANRDVQFIAEFRNNGNVFSSAEVILVIGNQTVDSQYLAIPPEYSRELTLNWIGVSGTFDVEVIIDPYNAIIETNENNNKRETVIKVIDEFIDLVITQDDIVVTQIEKSIFYDLTFKMKNTGNLPTGNFSARVTINGEEEYIGPINLDAESLTSRSKSLSADGKDEFYIDVFLDFDDEIKEANESNNKAYVMKQISDTDVGGDGDDPVFDEYIIFIILVPIIIIAAVALYYHKSTKNNYALMQNTLEEMRNSIFLTNLNSNNTNNTVVPRKKEKPATSNEFEKTFTRRSRESSSESSGDPPPDSSFDPDTHASRDPPDPQPSDYSPKSPESRDSPVSPDSSDAPSSPDSTDTPNSPEPSNTPDPYDSREPSDSSNSSNYPDSRDARRYTDSNDFQAFLESRESSRSTETRDSPVSSGSNDTRDSELDPTTGEGIFPGKEEDP